MIRKGSSLLVALLLLAACGAGTPNTPASSTSPAASGAGSTASPSGSAAASPSGSAAASPSGSAAATPSGSAAASPSGSADASVGGALVDQARIQLQALSSLAAQLGVPASSLSLKNATTEEFSDGSLGCPDPATSYIQAITPGYRIVFTDGTRDYDIRASQQGSIVWCNNGTPTSLGSN